MRNSPSSLIVLFDSAVMKHDKGGNGIFSIVTKGTHQRCFLIIANKYGLKQNIGYAFNTYLEISLSSVQTVIEIGNINVRILFENLLPIL